MKILCISDNIDPVIYSNSVQERFNDIDLILIAGDLPMEYVDFVVSTLNKPAYFVFGNHNLSEFSLFHNNGTNTYALNKAQEDGNWNPTHCGGAAYAGFKVLKEGNLLIAGISGTIRYNQGQCQYTESQMTMHLLRMIPKLLWNKIRYGRYLDIFLTHSPPRGIGDKDDPCHRGFKCFLWFLKKFSPKYMIHGHIHLYDLQDTRVRKFNETTIINAYSYYVLTI